MQLDADKVAEKYAELAAQRVLTGCSFVFDDHYIGMCAQFQQKDVNQDSDLNRKYSLHFKRDSLGVWDQVAGGVVVADLKSITSPSGDVKIVSKTFKEGKEKDYLEVWKRDRFMFAVPLDKIAKAPNFDSCKNFIFDIPK
jgi:hypothetical protein